MPQRQSQKLDNKAEEQYTRGIQNVCSLGDQRRIPSEQASSLNEKRKGMKKLLALIKEQANEVILLEYTDLLVRLEVLDPRHPA